MKIWNEPQAWLRLTSRQTSVTRSTLMTMNVLRCDVLGHCLEGICALAVFWHAPRLEGRQGAQSTGRLTAYACRMPCS